MLGVALSAVDRPSFSGLKGYRCFYATIGTHHLKHLPRLVVTSLTVSPPSDSAFWATTGLILQSVRSIKLLLTDRKSELLPAVTAYQGLVFKSHKLHLLDICVIPCS
jgi:hypothetical protein